MIEMNEGVKNMDRMMIGIVGLLLMFSPIGITFYYGQPLFLLLLIISVPFGVLLMGWLVGLVEKLNGREVK